ncbi:MAG: LytTR family transcriptional regulator DNA-binding domain-containing protein [Ruminococcus flavefaciens]|nr:LytTR family transcriptional regulator DNA-binding domain-containing protein [Ruminococcus flavefaciens]
MVRNSGEDFFYGSMRKLAEILEGKGYLCCHQSLMINCEHIIECSEKEIMLSNGEALPVSRRRKHYVIEEMRKWITNYDKI